MERIQIRNVSPGWLIDLTFNKVNRLFVYHLKMKVIEHPFESIIHQKLK